MSGREEYVVDTHGMPHDRQVAVCRRALTIIAPAAHTYETDIPMSNSSSWPPEVVAAAQHLSTQLGYRSADNTGYRQTGVMSALAAEEWNAFVTVAPFAYDASVWSKSHDQLASLADEGTSLVVLLSDHERHILEEFAGPSVVIPMKQWNKMRRRVLKERRRD